MVADLAAVFFIGRLIRYAEYTLNCLDCYRRLVSHRASATQQINRRRFLVHVAVLAHGDAHVFQDAVYLLRRHPQMAAVALGFDAVTTRADNAGESQTETHFLTCFVVVGFLGLQQFDAFGGHDVGRVEGADAFLVGGDEVNLGLFHVVVVCLRWYM